MRQGIRLFAVTLFVAVPSFAAAQADADGCKDTPLFTRMPKHYIERCEESPFEMRRYPVGPHVDDRRAKVQEVEGRWQLIVYRPNEGTPRASGLQIQRNFQNAAKAAGASVEGTYPEWCKFELDESFRLGNNCTDHGTSIKFTKDGKETWVFVNATAQTHTGYNDGYALLILEREAMQQDIVATELAEKIKKDGLVALYLNFETGSAALQASSNGQIDQVAGMLKAAPGLAIEIGGHTDNVGDAQANQKLSEARASAVVEALKSRGVAGARITSAGYGATQPVADNRTEEGRATNRRVELVKK